MPFLGRIGELVEIGRMGSEELCAEWRIRDVLSLPAGSDDYYASPHFRTGPERWWWKLYPDWRIERQDPASGWLRLGLVRDDGGPPKTFHFSVGIRGSGGVEKSREVEREFSGSDVRLDDFCSRFELTEHKIRLMPEDMFTIKYALKGPGSARGQQPSDHCLICYEKPVDSAFYRCGHMCMCYTCAFKLWKSNSSAQCPKCRDFIQDVVKVYK